MEEISLVLLLVLAAAAAAAAAGIPSVRLVHRFSAEGQAIFGSDGGETTSSMLELDLKRRRLGGQQLLPDLTFNYGNAMGWLHYTWIEVGMQNKSFLVALDTGSDFFWLPCDCVACASLSRTYYSTLGIELVEYSPSRSNTSRPITCNNELCKNASLCGSPDGDCPYLATYHSEDTSSTGFLFEDVLRLATIGEDKQQSSVYASVVIGCGRKQYGYLLKSGYAPNGIIGLGPGDLSVPSMLAKSGVIPHSYSFCYDHFLGGRLYFGDQGPISQSSTRFLPLKDYGIFVVEVDRCCVGSSCPNQTGFQAQVDTGTSFTYLPRQIHERVVSEFQRQTKAASVSKRLFENCYNASSLNMSSIPSLKLIFPENQSFLVQNLLFPITENMETFYCLGVHPRDGDIGFIGQNLLMGYRMVFDWEKLKLGWSASHCHEIGPDPGAPSEQGGSRDNVAPARMTCLFLFFCTTYVMYYMI